MASMSETDWSDLDVTELLPTGTVTLLLADVEGSMQLWESQPSTMTAAIEQLNRSASKLIAEHDGVRPVRPRASPNFDPDNPSRGSNGGVHRRLSCMNLNRSR